MPTLIINTTHDISANDAFIAINAEGNVHTRVDGLSFIVTGLNVHLSRIYTRITGRRCHYLSSPTVLLNK